MAIANCEQVTGVILTFVPDSRYSPVYLAAVTGELVPLLPYLDQKPLWEQLKSNEGGHFAFVDVLLCPSDAYAWQVGGQVNYVYNGGTTFRDFDPAGSGIINWQRRSRKLSEIEDGLSATAILSERLLGNHSGVSPEEARRETRR